MLTESDLSILYDQQQHAVGDCEGLSGSCAYCISEGIRYLLSRGVTIQSIQAEIIRCNDDSGSAVEEMLEGIDENATGKI